MNPRRLFIASCVSLIASAFSFIIRQDLLNVWKDSFHLTGLQVGSIPGFAFAGMAWSMAIGAFVVDYVGMKRVMVLAFFCHLLGTLGTICIPYMTSDSQTSYLILCLSTILIGVGNGLVEIAINPLTATIYSTEKTHMLNVLHSWWPGGQIVGGLITVIVAWGLGLGAGASAGTIQLAWQLKMGLILIPTIVYGAMILTQKFPVTERVASGVSTGSMLKEAIRPMFLLWAFCMMLTASTELAPQGLQDFVLQKTAGMPGTYILIYTSTLMFILRHFAGPIAHRVSPVGMLTVSAILSAIGLYLLSFANSPVTAILAATVFGLGIVYFWPTMLGVTAERFPRGGAFLLGIMGFVGNMAISIVSPWMGGITDKVTLENIPADLQSRVVIAGRVDPGKLSDPALATADKVVVENAQKEGARWSFRYVSALPALLVVIFGAIAVSDKMRGGYKPEQISAEKVEEASLASDY